MKGRYQMTNEQLKIAQLLKSQKPSNIRYRGDFLDKALVVRAGIVRGIGWQLFTQDNHLDRSEFEKACGDE